MKELSREYSIAPLAETLEVSKSGFYADQRKLQGRRSQQDQQLLGRIEKLFIQSRRTYGSPRLCAALRAQGCVCGKNRVARLMRVGGLRARQKRAFRPKTTLEPAPSGSGAQLAGKSPRPRSAQSGLAKRHHLSAHRPRLALSRRYLGRQQSKSRRLGHEREFAHYFGHRSPGAGLANWAALLLGSCTILIEASSMPTTASVAYCKALAPLPA
jgi:transposase InsO family protein